MQGPCLQLCGSGQAPPGSLRVGSMWSVWALWPGPEGCLWGPPLSVPGDLTRPITPSSSGLPDTWAAVLTGDVPELAGCHPSQGCVHPRHPQLAAPPGAPRRRPGAHLPMQGGRRCLHRDTLPRGRRASLPQPLCPSWFCHHCLPGLPSPPPQAQVPGILSDASHPGLGVLCPAQRQQSPVCLGAPLVGTGSGQRARPEERDGLLEHLGLPQSTGVLAGPHVGPG